MEAINLLALGFVLGLAVDRIIIGLVAARHPHGPHGRRR